MRERHGRHRGLTVGALVAAVALTMCDLLVDRNGLVGGQPRTEAGPDSGLEATTLDAARLDALCPPQQQGWCDLHVQISSVCPEVGNGSCGSLGGGVADSHRLVLWNGDAIRTTNEVYALDLDDTTFSALTSAILPPTPCSGTLPDGTPSARDAYDGFTYIPSSNQMFVYGGSLACDTENFINETWAFDLGALTWMNLAPTGDVPPDGYGSVDYDPVTGLVWVHTSDGTTSSLYSYDPAMNKYAQAGGDGVEYFATGRVDPKNRLFVLIGNAAVDVYDLNRSPPAHATWTSMLGSSDCQAMMSGDYLGVAYDTDTDQFAVWNSSTPTVLYFFDTGTMQCTTQEYAGGPQAVQGADDGVLGRFRYIPAIHAFVVVPDVDIDAFILRP